MGAYQRGILGWGGEGAGRVFQVGRMWHVEQGSAGWRTLGTLG